MNPSRRIVVLAIAALVLGACAAGEGIRPAPGEGTTSTMASTTTTSTTLSPSRYGGTVVIGVADLGSPRTLNPFLDGPDTATLDLIGPAVLARGYDIDPVTLDLIPDVLQEIPSPDDGTVIDLGDGSIEVTATVAGGARWADGSPITGDDLAFTILIATDTTLPIRSDVAARYAGIAADSLDVHGRSLTFRMKSSTDYQVLFDVILPEHAIEGTDFAADWNSTMWVAGGPFEFASWTPGQALELTRNDRYWRAGPEGAPLPYLERVIFRFYEPGPTLDPRVVEGLESGALDVVAVADATNVAEQIEAVSGVTLADAPGPGWYYLNFQFGPANRNDRSLNEHLEFRRAVASAIDRSGLAADRGARPLLSMLAPYGPRFSETPWDQVPYDRDAATSLLAGLGIALGVDLSLGSGPPVVVTVPSDDPGVDAVAGEIVTMLRDAGFDARLQLEASADFYGATTDNGSWDVSIGTFSAGPGVARVVALMEIFDPDGLPFAGDNFFRWGTVDSSVTGRPVDEYRALAADLRSAYGLSDASMMALDAETILADQMVIVPLMTVGRPGMAFRPDLLAGPALNVAEGLVWNVAEWTRQVTVGEGSEG